MPQHCSCHAGVERAADMAGAASAAVEEVAAEGRRRLAELAAVAVERLLALGRSLDAQVLECDSTAYFAR